MTDWTGPDPNEPVRDLAAYATPTPRGPIDLELAGNEGPAPPAAVLDALAGLDADELRRYPDLAGLTETLATRHAVDPARVLVTAGGDQAIDLLARTFLGPGRTLLTHRPSFVMIERAARLAGGSVEAVPWDRGGFPRRAFVEAADDRTPLAVVVSPNNPTGGTITADELRSVADALAPALVVLDHAYVEFADDDLTDVALGLPNAAVIRTLSKAFGLAGARVGYLLGPPPLVDFLGRIRSPYPVAAPSIVAATARLAADDDVGGFIERIRSHRDRLVGHLDGLGVDPYPSEANFVLGRYPDARWAFDGLAGLGIRTRLFPDRDGLEDHLRITVPGDAGELARLEDALAAVLAPGALVLDMDGVIADVRESYRVAIIETAAAHGVELTHDDIEHRKRRGDANDDWVLTHELLAEAGVDVGFDAVKATFEAHYLGEVEGREPLFERERLLGGDALEELAGAVPLAIVTGRPRRDATRFLERHGIGGLFDAVVCKEDADDKPDPAPVNLALERLGREHAWLVGDTPDDVVAARRAGAVPLGIVAPGGDVDAVTAALLEAGAARVLDDLADLNALRATALPR